MLALYSLGTVLSAFAAALWLADAAAAAVRADAHSAAAFFAAAVLCVQSAVVCFDRCRSLLGSRPD